MFIQSSPGSELKRKFQAEVDRSGLRIRVVEKAGRSIKSALQRSDPFKSATCDRDTCLVCETGGKGSCSTNGVNYAIKCVGCERTYHGETSRNGFSRGKEHLQELDGQAASSVMWRHCRERHGGTIQDFTMDITGNYRNDAMLRQIAEAVRIDNTPRGKLLNNKTEWNYVQFPRVLVDNGDEA